MFRRLLAAALSVAVLAAPVLPAAAAPRIKDISDFEGVRDNLQVSYGLVVGLNNTGDTLNNIPFTKQSLQAMLERMGVNIRGATILAMRRAIRRLPAGTVHRNLLRRPVFIRAAGLGQGVEP